MKTLLATLSFLAAGIQPASGYEGSLAYGINPPFGGVHVKTAQFDVRSSIAGSAFWHKIGYGHWFEAGEGTSGGVAAYSVGVRADSAPLYGELFWGVGKCFSCDGVWLSGNLQFVNDVAVGVSNGAGFGVGLAYRHVSNAGIAQPNRGRDFLMFQTRFAF